MNRRQREVMQAQLNGEKEIISKLETMYRDAMAEVDARIAKLDEREGMEPENIQSIVYQRKYQQAIRNQIDRIIDNIQDLEFEDINDYLNWSYQVGYLGTMYDLHGQGIPIISPINQDEVTRAIRMDSKLSKSLYATLGEDLDRLKESVRQAISRKVSQGRSWTEAAKEIAGGMRTPYDKAISYAVRIARTEGHRVQVASSLDAMEKAKDKGAEIVKQWDATLDGRTRPDHRKLDGQIRELDESFEVKGHKAKAPGHFGRPEEDINCRCSITQRAKWALDEDELRTLEDRAAFFGLDKADDLEEFRSKYLRAVEEVKETAKKAANAVKKAVGGLLDISGWPDMFKTKTAQKRMQKFVDIVSEGNPDEKTLELYNLLGNTRNILNGQNTAKLRFTEKDHKAGWGTVQIPKMEGEGLRGQAFTVAHELGHYIDANSSGGRTGDFFFCWRKQNDFPRMSPDDLPEWIRERSARYKKRIEEIREEAKNEFVEGSIELKRRFEAQEITLKEWREKFKVMENRYYNGTDKVIREEMQGWNAVEDIMDALTRGAARDRGVVSYGHGSKYYAEPTMAVVETWANYCSLQLLEPDLLDDLRKDFPDLISMFDKLRDDMLEEARNNA